MSELFLSWRFGFCEDTVFAQRKLVRGTMGLCWP